MPPRCAAQRVRHPPEADREGIGPSTPPTSLGATQILLASRMGKTFLVVAFPDQKDYKLSFEARNPCTSPP